MYPMIASISLVSGLFLFTVGSIVVVSKDRSPQWHLFFYILIPVWVVILALLNFKVHPTWSLVVIFGILLTIVGLTTG
jgi:hypothetical protein